MIEDEVMKLAEIHTELQMYLDSDDCTDPIGYLETLEARLGKAIAALDSAELAARPSVA